MSRHPLLFSAVALSALLGFHALRSSSPPAAKAPAKTIASAPAARAAASAPDAQRAAQARYRVSFVQRAFLDGREQAAITVEGRWITTARAGGRTEARLEATRVEVEGDQAPSAADLAAPIELVTSEGVLAKIAFSAETPRAARAVLTGLATTFQHTDRTGSAWSAEEEDLLGRYVAEYQRSGDRVMRKRPRYTRLRDAGGLAAAHAGGITSAESTELRFDDQGLVSATVRVAHTMEIARGKAPLRASLEATLVREETAEVPLIAGLALDPAPISDHVDRAALARSRDRKLVGAATRPELVAEAQRVAHLDRDDPGARALRLRTQQRLAAIARLDGGAPGALAEVIRKDPRDREVLSLVSGALSAAGAPAATDALASLLEGDALPVEARAEVLSDLALAGAPTAESVAVLSRALDQPLGDQAALALGAHARGLDGDGAADDAIDELLQRYASATAPEAKRTLLLALANTGSRRVLGAMRAAITGPDFELARVGTFGLRLIPGDDVDDQLAALIASGSIVAVEAVQAVAYRSPALWRPRLLAAKAQFVGQKRMLDAIASVLVRWENEGGT